MTFTGYCTPAELAKFLDFGNWREFPIQSFDTSDTYYLPLISDDNKLTYAIEGTVSATNGGVLIDPGEYTVDYETGKITWETGKEPTDGDSIVFIYYVMRGFTNADLKYYILLGARRLEKDANAVFRELTSEYVTDGNLGYDYIHYLSDVTLQLPYNVLSVEELNIDGTDVTVSSLKIKGNNVSLTRDSEVRYFSGKANTTYISVTHGIPDEEADRTEEQNRLVDFAKEANICISAIMMLDSPNGRNTLLDNSYVVQRSDGSVRPDLTIEAELTRYEKKYQNLLAMLQMINGKLI